MRADSIGGFWANWYGLLHDLVLPGLRTLYFGSIVSTFPCFYRSCDVKELCVDSDVWCKFVLTVEFTGLSEEDCLADCTVLATEAGEVVLLDDGSAIELD